MLKDVIATYRKDDGNMQAELDALDAEIKAHNATLDGIKTQLKTLRGKTVETDTVKDSINLMLCDSGMRGFSLEPKAGVDSVYEVRRPDGTIWYTVATLLTVKPGRKSLSSMTLFLAWTAVRFSS